MQGLMMDMPLLLSMFIAHAGRYHGATEVVAREIDGRIHRSNYAEVHRRTQRMAKALRRLGVG